MLPVLAPGNAAVLSPALDAQVPSVGHGLSGLLVADEQLEIGLSPEALEHLDRFAAPDRQAATELTKALVELGEAAVDKRIVGAVRALVFKKLWLVDVERHDRSALRRLPERLVVAHAQVTLEPDDGGWR